MEIEIVEKLNGRAPPSVKPSRRLAQLIQLTNSMTTRKLLPIAALALLARAAWVLMSDNSALGTWSDQGGGIALNILEGRGYIFSYGPNPPYLSFRVPVFPLFLYGVWSIVGFSVLAAKLVLAAVSTVNVILTAFLAKRLFGDGAGVIAALLAAVFPNFIYWAGTLGPETLTMSFLLVTVLMLLRGRFWLSGISAGLLILTRVVFLPYAAMLAVWVFMNKRNVSGLKSAFVFAAFAALALTPWVYRNWRAHGQFLLLSTEGGLVFFECNNAQALAEGGDWSHDYYYYAPELKADAWRMSEVDFDRLLYRRGMADIMESPGHFLRAFLLRIYQLWRPFPRGGYNLLWTSLFFAAWFPIFLIAMWQILSVRVWRQADHWPLLFAILWVTLSSGITYSIVRYRAPVEPLIIIYGAGGGQRILRWISAKVLVGYASTPA